MISNTTASQGGPIIALPAEIAKLWRGTLPPLGVEVPENWQWGSGDIICDYDRACDVINDTFPFGYDSFGWIPVGESKALVFTIEQVIAFIPEQKGGVIAGSFFELDTLEELIKSVAPEKWNSYPQTINLKDGRIFLFDSAYEGYENPEEIKAFDNVVVAQLSPGTYKIYHYNSEDNVGLVRMEKISE